MVLDGRSIVLDFFGLVLWDFIPSNQADIRQVEVIRGPASAVWGANALTGVVNVITKAPRETLGCGSVRGRHRPESTSARKSSVIELKRPGSSFATRCPVPNDRWSYRISAGYFNSDPLSRPWADSRDSRSA